MKIQELLAAELRLSKPSYEGIPPPDDSRYKQWYSDVSHVAFACSMFDSDFDRAKFDREVWSGR